MTELITITIENHVADVRLNRPEKYNALSEEMFEAIGGAVKTLSDNKSVRAVVLSGNGKGFCAGLDFGRFQQMEGGEFGDAGGDITDRMDGNIVNYGQYIAYGWKQLPVPVIAAVHGVAFGGGCQIALGADIRLARPDAKFSVMEMKWGLIPDMSGKRNSQTLRDEAKGFMMESQLEKELISSPNQIEAVH